MGPGSNRGPRGTSEPRVCDVISVPVTPEGVDHLHDTLLVRGVRDGNRTPGGGLYEKDVRVKPLGKYPEVDRG